MSQPVIIRKYMYFNHVIFFYIYSTKSEIIYSQSVISTKQMFISTLFQSTLFILFSCLFITFPLKANCTFSRIHFLYFDQHSIHNHFTIRTLRMIVSIIMWTFIQKLSLFCLKCSIAPAKSCSFLTLIRISSAFVFSQTVMTSPCSCLMPADPNQAVMDR